jgi:NADPH-dependent ferric siderophore reductase
MTGTTAFPEPRELVLTVVAVAEVTEGMRRVTFAGAGLEELVHLPGQDMAITVPAGEGETVRRRYTIRSLDRAGGRVSLDFVLHGDGPAARWVSSVEPGAVIEVVAPRGKITLDPEADWHLFAGDETAIAAVAAMVGALEEGARAIALLEIEGPEQEQAIEAAEGVSVETVWLHRLGVAPGESDLLPAAITALKLPEGTGHAYLAGEYSLVQLLRRTLQERGLAQEQISPKPYWRLGRRNMPHGEPERD